MSEAEVEAIADFLGCSVGEVKLMYTRVVGARLSLREFANGDCVFLDPRTRLCRIHPVRPRQCLAWPFWPSNLQSPESWNRTKAVCPGAGTGELVPVEEIERLASLIDL